MALDLGKARRMETDAAIAGVRRVRNEEVLCCIVLCRAVSCCVVSPARPRAQTKTDPALNGNEGGRTRGRPPKTAGKAPTEPSQRPTLPVHLRAKGCWVGR